MTNALFFAETEELATLAPGSLFVLAGAEGRHASTVKRLAPGEPVDVVDGNGLRIGGTVTEARSGELELRVESVDRAPDPAERLVLVQALAKGDRDELAIETATELGVDAVLPWQAERSIVRWKGDRAAKSLAKWRAVVRAAAKQARRSWIPPVDEAVDTPALVRRAAAAGLAIVLHEEATEPLRKVLERRRSALAGAATDAAAPEILLIVGPEGGISPRELGLLVDAGAETARLGPHVLRSSTAGPAAVALLSEALGRW
ncbi:MAG: rRNA ((1498)-N(3))-methyltransferase [Micrococcaceae bacterium]|nr:rRNA ((1498)-N(3))-methyltransferase [Micrococcaceae bacterium]